MSSLSVIAWVLSLRPGYRVVHDKSLLGLPLQSVSLLLRTCNTSKMLLNNDAAVTTKPPSYQPAWWKDGITIYEVRSTSRAFFWSSLDQARH